MKINQEAKDRKLAIELSKEYGAVKTAAMIADKNSHFQDIIAFAIDEVGRDTVEKALKQGPKYWYLLGWPSEQLAEDGSDNNVAKAGDRICKFHLFQGGAYFGIARINKDTQDYRCLKQNKGYDFNPADQKITEGSEVTFYFGVQDGGGIGLAFAPESFIFDSTSPLIAYYESSGLAGTQKFALQNHTVS